jgi:hypothetical protein
MPSYNQFDRSNQISQACVQRPPLGPKIVLVDDMLILFRSILRIKSSKWDLKAVVVIYSWSLFGSTKLNNAKFGDPFLRIKLKLLDGITPSIKNL